MKRRNVLCREWLSALIDVAVSADRLVDLILEGKSDASVIRTLILELDRVDAHKIGDLDEVSQDFQELEFDRVELHDDGNIWVYHEDDREEEEACPAKT